MKTDKASTESSNQKQASNRLTSETEQQINPSIKFDPRQESSETIAQNESSTHSKTTPKTIEDAPTVGATKGGL